MKNAFSSFVHSRKALGGALLTLMLLLAACGGGAAPEVAVEEGAPAAEEAPPAEESGSLGSGQCANEYYPVVEGANWTYTGTSFDGPFTWSTTTSGVSDSGFTLTQTYDIDGEILVVTQQWACNAAGVAALEYGGGPEGNLTASGLDFTFETIESSGVSFPKSISVGDTWEQSYTIEGVITMTEGMSATTSGVVTHNYTAAGIETVSVPAGTFEALRVVVDTQFDLQVDMMGIGVGMPFSLNSQSTTWLARNVGWIKSDSSASFEGSESLSAAVELQGYTIP